MTARVKGFVEDFQGEGFNEKFENLVIYCLENKNEIDQKIEEGMQILKKQSDKITNNRKLLDKIDWIGRYIEQTVSLIEK